MIGGATAHACFRKKAIPDARTLSVLSPGYASRRSAGFAGTVSAASGLMPGWRGGWPPAKQKDGVPQPRGAGGGGGGRKSREGSVGRRQRRQEFPFGTAVAGRAGNQPDKPPARVPVRQGRPAPARVQPWGCKGRSPLHKITLISPFPLGRGWGGWGLGNNLKAGSAGGKESTPPA